MSKKKSNPMFSLKRYLLNKAQRRLAKLQYRAEKRENKGVASHNHEHHDHEHLEVHEDELTE